MENFKIKTLKEIEEFEKDFEKLDKEWDDFIESNGQEPRADEFSEKLNDFRRRFDILKNRAYELQHKRRDIRFIKED